MDENGLTSTLLSVREDGAPYGMTSVPDLLGYLQRETELTRSTLAEFMVRSGRLAEVYANPQQWLDQAVKAIRRTLHDRMIDGIKYEKIAGQVYEMREFEEHEIEGYLSRMLEVGNSIYDVIEFESQTEKNFAEILDKRDDIKLFIKLPRWFKVETPIGTYNQDWAIVKQGSKKVYLVRETKGTQDVQLLRTTEQDKIACGKAHFEAMDVDFKVVTKAEEV